MSTKPPIRVIAICLFSHQARVLVFEAFDRVKGSYYYRPLGGGVERGERTVDALRREIREEIGQEICDVQLLAVLENLFECDGRPGHEIVFVYDATFVDPTIYRVTSLLVQEDDGATMTAAWRGLDTFDEHHRLVPEELSTLLAGDDRR